MKNKIVKRKDIIFAIIVSLILHIFVFSFINTSIVKSVFAYDRVGELEENIKKDDYMSKRPISKKIIKKKPHSLPISL